MANNSSIGELASHFALRVGELGRHAERLIFSSWEEAETYITSLGLDPSEVSLQPIRARR